MKKEITTFEQLSVFAQEIADSLRGGEILGLVGELGAGKTTFTQMLAKELGVREQVKSPTFTLMQEYQAGDVAKQRGIKKLLHVDAYRIEDPREFGVIGLYEEAGAPDVVTVVEWVEKLDSGKVEQWKSGKYRELKFVEENGQRFVIQQH